MRMIFDTIREENFSAKIARVLGKIVLDLPTLVLAEIIIMVLQNLKFDTARFKDIVRIAAARDVELSDDLQSYQRGLVATDRELIDKQQQSAATSRAIGAEKKRAEREKAAKDAAERAEFEAWKRANRP